MMGPTSVFFEISVLQSLCGGQTMFRAVNDQVFDKVDCVSGHFVLLKLLFETAPLFNNTIQIETVSSYRIFYYLVPDFCSWFAQIAEDLAYLENRTVLNTSLKPH